MASADDLADLRNSFAQLKGEVSHSYQVIAELKDKISEIEENNQKDLTETWSNLNSFEEETRKGFETLGADPAPAYVWGAIQIAVIAGTLA